MEQKFSKNTLFNFFSGNASPLQKKAIEEWLEEESNREWFFEWLKEWENEHPQFLADTDLAYERFKFNLKTGSKKKEVRLLHTAPHRKIRVWMVAASVLLLLCCSLWFLQDIILYKTYTTAFGQIKSITLEDNSRVALNANSSLRVPRYSFGYGDRVVYLKGEAEFSITHTPTHQKFIVTTPDKLSVEVLGTKFIVYSRPRGSKVILQTGKVRVSNASNESLTIAPGDVVSLDQKGALQKQPAQNVEKYSAWKERRFIFDHSTLTEITYLIEENFGVKVSIPDTALANRSLSGTFQANNVKEMLEMLSDVSDLQISQEDNVYILRANE
ncbi:FecR domain-containing protein [Rhodocytophaga aerolata]|uniref:FecR domain-containing protein n=1 Tax=Rhodocytophaga aerolata TaxID=455078 RepID=A0ABT8RH06_9BACT|nr:FecR domain-containing protein [Rhodocytophaga aerolata]MDO1451383.1 FecR domain-containing protein [Rhodocytophaga aerolata]